MKRKSVLILLLLLIVCANSLAFELNDLEKKLLAERKVFKILVSPNNYPYEYLNSNDEFEGINIDVYRALFHKLNRKVSFTHEDESIYDIDLVSSFVTNQRFQDLSTNSFFTVYYYALSTNLNISSTKQHNIYMIKQDLSKTILPEFASNKQFIYSDISLAYHDFTNDRNGLLLVDNFHKTIVDELMQMSNKSFSNKRLNTEIDAKLWLKNEDRTLYLIITKVLNEMLYNNEITCIVSNWEKKSNKKVLFERNYEQFYVISFFFTILFIAVIILLYYYNVMKKDLILNSYDTISRNKELMLHNHDLKLIISQMEQENVTVLNNLSNIALTIDLKGTIRFVNKSFSDILGYNNHTIIGTNIDDILQHGDTVKLLSLNPDSSQKQENEIVIKSAEGFYKTFIYNTNFSKTVDGETNINCILQDISERISLDNRLEAYTTHLEELIKQRTQVLKQSEEQFRFIVEHAYDGIVLMQNFKIQLANQAFYQIVGVDSDKESLDNTSFLNVIPQDEHKEFLETFNNATNNKEESFIIVHKVSVSGNKTIDVETHFTSINYSDKILELAILHNIEEKKAKERELIEHEKFLTVSSFAITANDKINSPLNAILGYTELLDVQTEKKTKTQRNAFDNIYESIGIIQKILNQLKSMTKVTMENYNFDNQKMLKIDDEYTDEHK
ncbi:MAG: PAS domain S-box protein [Candidatus Cloacimonadales bacterium]|jgi:PAS domain S-box-containing protein|nr:PAS domain S-box protein [Candidatus Cloacimonadota bacterium]MDX9977920.1 PAS domain S-box protein [Candidatus Cloacimonadales bacterium]